MLSVALAHDVITRSASAGLRSNEIVALGDRAVFTTAIDAAVNLCISDGSAAGTSSVYSFPFVSADLMPGQLATSGSRVYLYAHTSINGRELWCTDGTTAGTYVLTSFANSLVSPIAGCDVSGTFYFAVDSGGTNRELWKSDGTVAGTALITSQFKTISSLAACDGKLYISADDGTSGTELWACDGTAGGTYRVKDLNATGSSTPANLTALGSTLFFTANDNPSTNSTELWKTDGTDAGTQHVITLNTGCGSAAIRNLIGVDQTLYFVGVTSTSGTELWKSDGTTTGTMIVKDIQPGSFSSSPTALTSMNGMLYFINQHTQEIWKSDGTPDGTLRVAAMPGAQIPLSLTAAASKLYFIARGDKTGNEPWCSDGTEAGTQLLKDIKPGYAFSFPDTFTAVGNRIFFAAVDGTYGRQLWSSTGTPQTTTVAADLGWATVGSSPYALVALGGRVMFSTQSTADACQLWLTDGTPTGLTRIDGARLKTTGYVTGSSQGTPTIALAGGNLFHNCGDSLAVCSWDGRAYPLSDAIGTPVRYPSDLTAMGSLCYFSATDNVFGHELWRSDGTAAGTYMVTDLNPGSNSTHPRNITNVDGTIYFTTIDGKLYKSDGTAAGTTFVSSATDFSAVFNAISFKGKMVLARSDGLWISDGTAAGTVQIAPARGISSVLRVIGNAFYFLALDAVGKQGLFRSDGTTAGTSLVTLISGDPSSISAGQLTVVGDRLFFVGPGGQTLWTSDTTAAGTIQLATAASGSNVIQELTAAGGILYFRDSTATAGTELWQSDGTVAGTFMVSDLYPGSTGSAPSSLTEVDGTLFFAAMHPIYGTELWKVETPRPAPSTPANFKATAVSSGRIELSWDDSTMEAGFRIERCSSGDFATIEKTFDIPPDTTAISDTLLTPGQTFFYRLTAFNRGGNSASVTISAGTPAGPMTPGALELVSLNDNRVELSWADQATDETAYVVERSFHSDFRSIDASFDLPANSTSFVDTTMTPTGRYSYRVYAVGAGTTSDVRTFQVSIPDRAPGSLMAVGVSSSEIDLKWTDSSTTETSFHIERCGSDGVFKDVDTVVANQDGYSNWGLIANSIWTYRVVAYTATGKSYSLPVTATTRAPQLTSFVALPSANDHRWSSWPSKVTGNSNGIGFFTAYTSDTGREVWRTDGTSAGTYLLKDVCYSTSESLVQEFGEVNGITYFVGSYYDGATGFSTALLKSDGTTGGTVLVKRLPSQYGPLNFHDLTSYNGKLYFRGPGTTSGTSALWVSDGTEAGTGIVQTYTFFWGQTYCERVAVAGGKLYFGANGALYASDGTAAGTNKITDDALANSIMRMTPVGNTLYFSAVNPADNGQYLWKTDGTVAGTVKVDAAIGIENLCVIGSTLYVAGYDQTTGWGLYKTSGGAMTLVKDLFVGALGTKPLCLTTVGARAVFFTTDSTANQVKVWSSDGTGTGTTVLQTLTVVAGSADMPEAVSCNGRAYYVTRDATDGWLLWKTDGTVAGTGRVTNFTGSNRPSGLSAVNGMLMFAADNVTNGAELWKSDGTAAGTTLVKDIVDPVVTPWPNQLTVFKGRLFFKLGANEAAGGVWATDGTPEGTQMIRDGVVDNLLAGADYLWFTCTESATGAELWRTDGTTAGTVMVKDVVPGYVGSKAVPLAELNGKLLFGVVSSDGLTYEIWKTDGTAAATVKITDPVLCFTTVKGIRYMPIVANGRMFFVGGTGYDTALYSTDGTAAGTVRIRYLSYGGSGGYPLQTPCYKGYVYFAAYDPGTGCNLYKTDGTLAGTSVVKYLGTSFNDLNELTVIGDSLYYRGSESWLWKSDGTAAGTVQFSDGTYIYPRYLTGVGSKLFFFAWDPVGRTNWLYASDGTSAGTTRVRKASMDGTAAGGQAYALAGGDRFYWCDGSALWSSDGTLPGTFQVRGVSDGSHEFNQTNAPRAAVLNDRIVLPAASTGGARELRFAAFLPPLQPSDLDVASVSGGGAGSGAGAGGGGAAAGVVLTWKDHAANEAGFVIQRSLTPDFAIIDSSFFAEANSTSHTDTTTGTTAYFYRVRAVNAAGDSQSSSPVTSGRPGALSTLFEQAAAPNLKYQFSANVSATLTRDDLVLQNLTTGMTLPSSQISLTYNSADNTATINLGSLADGRYRLTLRFDGVAGTSGLILDKDYVLDFVHLAGDADSDGSVRFADLVRVAQNYDMVSGAAWARGDFNGDGAVNFRDLVILAQNYNTTLPEPGPVAEMADSSATAMQIAVFEVSAADRVAPAATTNPIQSGCGTGESSAPAVAETPAYHAAVPVLHEAASHLTSTATPLSVDPVHSNRSDVTAFAPTHVAERRPSVSIPSRRAASLTWPSIARRRRARAAAAVPVPVVCPALTPVAFSSTRIRRLDPLLEPTTTSCLR